MFEFPSLSAMIYISNTVTSYNHVGSSTVYCDTWNSVNNALNDIHCSPDLSPLISFLSLNTYTTNNRQGPGNDATSTVHQIPKKQNQSSVLLLIKYSDLELSDVAC